MLPFKVITILTISTVCAVANAVANVQITVDCLSKESKSLKHFWKSSGFSPPEPRNSTALFLLSQDEQFNLLLASSLPHSGIQYMRIHWLLTLISYQDGNYNFSNLDTFLDFLILQTHLKPGFELMGLPINIEKETVLNNNYNFWYNLIKNIGSRYIDRYGLRELKKWRFETLNEPDLKQYNFLNFSLSQYLEYVDACMAGLQSAVLQHPSHKSIRHVRNSSVLKVAGPGGLFKRRDRHPLCWGFVAHCLSPSPSPASSVCANSLAYVSFHKKGNGSASRVLSEDLQVIRSLRNEFPQLDRLPPLANDEADILTNWSLEKEWRAHSQYAALVAAVVLDHYREIVLKLALNFELLSNDNAFLSYTHRFFTQRTLLARFEMNNTNPRHVQFIKKPVFSVMGLLSKLGDEWIPVLSFFEEQHQQQQQQRRLMALASRSPESASVLLVHVDEEDDSRTGTAVINLTLENLMSSARYVIYAIDNKNVNPYSVWMSLGSPVFPNVTSRHKMRLVEEPYRVSGPSIAADSGLFRFEMNLPSVYLVHVCMHALIPGRPRHLQARNVTFNEVSLFWKDTAVNTRCIKTYEVEFAPQTGVDFKRINQKDTIFLSYQYVADGAKDNAKGRFRVRAVNYWNQPGPYSKTIRFP